ncbi:MAG: hypothetical protein P857_601 [Candidatus Xenolissoclinum pacificiensis L6]|uniref:Uncharacterized protein n=1 Tax=Candidatus Xenolissoclinum pacificiensis L6 TaxID=1401685 RepID=W2UZ18_9RICK|nr:MAG: hypothetical protein P857_601 [Candidatus Xenolissoclinum pacificiensis L6]
MKDRKDKSDFSNRKAKCCKMDTIFHLLSFWNLIYYDSAFSIRRIMSTGSNNS